MKSYSEVAGDGGSRIAEQVAEQRARIERNLAGVRSILAVGSGKGGVGKSTVTRALAAMLARRGRRVAVLDADLNGPAQARLAGLAAAPLAPGPAGLEMPRGADGIGVVSLGALVPETEAVEFESVAHGDSHVWRATREFGFLGQLVATVVWGELDFLLVDLPPGTERTVQHAEFLGPAAALLLVTLPADLARGVVSRTVAALGRTPNRLHGYVENMHGYYCADCGRVQPLFPQPTAPPLDLPCLATVPFDPALAALGGGLDSSSPAAQAIGALAERLEQIEGLAS